MNITVFVSEDLALAAICYFLSCDPWATIKSRKQFMSELKLYVLLFGESSMDDHINETSRVEEAEKIIDKYYKN